LIKNVQGWDYNYITTKNHGIWSIKKLIALDYYIDSYVKILKKNDFKSWYYVDPFSGSGLIKIDNNFIFPGSPLIPLFKTEKYPFHKYILSDYNSKYVQSLKKIVAEKINKSNASKQNFNIDIQNQDCNSLIQKIFTGTKPNNWMNQSYLVFLDPFGWNIKWASMERILNSGPVDIIFTFMTWGIKWNMTMEKSKTTLNDFFGDKEWQSIENNTEIVGYYCDKIKRFGYKNKYKTYTIDVTTTSGNTYNLILASQSPGAGNVFTDLQKRVNEVTTDCLEDAFNVTVGKTTDLTKFF
jgi:three-Cys-motif partner protein